MSTYINILGSFQPKIKSTVKARRNKAQRILYELQMNFLQTVQKPQHSRSATSLNNARSQRCANCNREQNTFRRSWVNLQFLGISVAVYLYKVPSWAPFCVIWSATVQVTSNSTKTRRNGRAYLFLASLQMKNSNNLFLYLGI